MCAHRHVCICQPGWRFVACFMQVYAMFFRLFWKLQNLAAVSTNRAEQSCAASSLLFPADLLGV